MKPNRPLFIPVLLLLSIAALHQFAMWYERTHLATDGMWYLKRNIGMMFWSIVALVFALPTSLLLLVRTFRVRNSLHAASIWAAVFLALTVPALAGLFIVWRPD